MNVHGDLIAANPLIVEENKNLQKRTEMHMGTDVAIERYSRATENDKSYYKSDQKKFTTSHT